MVRLTHWGIGVAVLLGAPVTKGGGSWHVSLGRSAMALVPFSAFPPNLLAAMAQLRQLGGGGDRRITLCVVIGSGLVLTGGATPMQVAADMAAVASGDWSALIRKDSAGQTESPRRERVEEVHEMAVNLLLFLAALHVAGVFIECRVMRRNLLAPMILGQRRK